MTTSSWRVAWQAPVRVSVSPDHSSIARISFTATDSDAGTDVVQFAIGLDVTLTLVTHGGPVTVVGREATGRLVSGVVEVLHESTSTGAGEQEPGESPATEPAPGPPAPAGPPAESTSLPDSRPTGGLPSRELVAELQPDLDETIITPVGVPGPEAPGFPVADNADDRGDLTSESDDPDATVIGATPSRGDGWLTDDDATILPDPAPRLLRIEIGDADGSRVYELDGALYLGRAPRIPAERSAEPGGLAVVRSSTPHMSATHLQLRAEHGQLLARDLWSTNGTVLAPAGGDPFRLEPGETLPVAAGATLHLADDVSVAVASGSDEPGRRPDEAAEGARAQ